MTTFVLKLTDGEELVIEEAGRGSGDPRERAIDRRREALDEDDER